MFEYQGTAYLKFNDLFSYVNGNLSFRISYQKLAERISRLDCVKDRFSPTNDQGVRIQRLVWSVPWEIVNNALGKADMFRPQETRSGTLPITEES